MLSEAKTNTDDKNFLQFQRVNACKVLTVNLFLRLNMTILTGVGEDILLFCSNIFQRCKLYSQCMELYS